MPASQRSDGRQHEAELQSDQRGTQSGNTKLRLTRRIRLLAHLANRYQCSASTLVGTVLITWCKRSFPALPPPALPHSSQLARERAVEGFVILLQALDLLEAIYWLSSLYAAVADNAYRKRLALFFTPPSLSEGLLEDLVKHGVDFAKQSFMDPACGGAAFLAPIASRMRTALLAQGITPRRILRHIEVHLRGMDIDSTLCEMSKHFLLMVFLKSEIEETGYVPKFGLTKKDSLANLATSEGVVDVVVCNPPYRKMTADEVENLRMTFGEVIEAQPNLYGLFMELSVRLVPEEGTRSARYSN